MVCLCRQQVAKGREDSISHALKWQHFFHQFLTKKNVSHRAVCVNCRWWEPLGVSPLRFREWEFKLWQGYHLDQLVYEWTMLLSQPINKQWFWSLQGKKCPILPLINVTLVVLLLPPISGSRTELCRLKKVAKGNWEPQSWDLYSLTWPDQADYCDIRKSSLRFLFCFANTRHKNLPETSYSEKCLKEERELESEYRVQYSSHSKIASKQIGFFNYFWIIAMFKVKLDRA